MEINMNENNYYEIELEQEIDNFDVQAVIDFVMMFIVCAAIITCLISFIINIKEYLSRRNVEKIIKKMRNEKER